MSVVVDVPSVKLGMLLCCTVKGASINLGLQLSPVGSVGLLGTPLLSWGTGSQGFDALSFTAWLTSFCSLGRLDGYH